MFDCFVSYKVGADDALAHDFASFLKNDDFTVFIDKKGLLPGKNWAAELQQSMSRSNYVLAFFTADYVSRIEYGNNDGQNFIIEELNWALKDKKLIPISVGVPINIIEEKCSEWVAELNGIQFIHFENKESIQFQTILNQLNKLIRINNKKKHSLPSSVTQLNSHELSIHQAYIKLSMPWPTDEALKYKTTLETKFLKDPIDYVVLAKFHLVGRFGIKIEPEVAHSYLEKAARHDCAEAFFELGVLYQDEDTQYGGDEDKATEYYTQAHQLDNIRATYQLALLFDENIENSHSPTQFLKNKYGIEHCNQFIDAIWLKKEHYSTLNEAEKYSYCLTQIHANENKAQAIEEIHKLASLGYLNAVGWLGDEYCRKESEVVQDPQKSLTYLHAGDEQGHLWCRAYLASIYLETEYRALGFDESIALGLQKHQQNIQLNYYQSAYDLAWVIDNRPELQQYISIDEQIVFLEKAVEFGQKNCREFLTKLYIKSKHPSLCTFAIQSANEGDISSALKLLAETAFNESLKEIINETSYQALYNIFKKEIHKAQPKRALHLISVLMNFAMGFNHLQDALDLVIFVDKEYKKEGAHYSCAKQIALKGYRHSKELVFELLKKGDELDEVNCRIWLILICLGRINSNILPILKDNDFQSSFLNGINRADFRNDLKCSSNSEIEVVNSHEKLIYVPVDESLEGLITIQGAMECAELLSTKDCTTSDNINNILSRFINFTILDKPIISFVSIRIAEKMGYPPQLPAPEYINFKKIKSYPFLCNDNYNNTFDLSVACYKKLFVESSIKHGYQAQGALYTFTAYLIGTSNVANNEEHIQKHFQQFNYDVNKKLYEKTDRRQSLRASLNIEEEFIVPFIWLFLQFFGSSQTQESPWFYQNAEILFLTLARNVKDKPHFISHFKPIITDTIKYLRSDKFSAYLKNNERLVKLLTELSSIDE